MSIALMNKMQKRIAVIEIFGAIGGAVKSPEMDRLLNTARDDHRIKAVVLDVDSPGGGSSASDYIYRSVKRLAERKPVIAAIRGTGASGSYMIACGAQRIVASPGAIIGSIGVISVRPVLEDLLERAGIKVNVNKTGVYKDMGALWREATPEEQEKMQSLIDDIFGDFVTIVSEARGLEESAVRDLATGEVYLAERARELGLVDELGDLHRAIDIAAELSGAPPVPVYLRPKRTLRQMLFGSAAESLVQAVADQVEQRIFQSRFRL